MLAVLPAAAALTLAWLTALSRLPQPAPADRPAGGVPSIDERAAGGVPAEHHERDDDPARPLPIDRAPDQAPTDDSAALDEHVPGILAW